MKTSLSGVLSFLFWLLDLFGVKERREKMKLVNILFVSNNSNSLFSFGNAKRVQKMRKINMEKARSAKPKSGVSRIL